ncbi:MAG TPA: DNA-3-methyladenine glycosylase 2 family protein [Clostridiaceae bacterium]|nr:DNA-3-methyladenine glycosylase 2 family protein [Clostridiaceae bacterium]
MSKVFFPYGETEITYLKSKDKKLSSVIDQIGHIEREVEPDLFSSVILTIIGQQISGKARDTICQRLTVELGEITAETILVAGAARIQQFGMSLRKATYISDFAKKVESGEFDLEGIKEMTDEEAMAALTELKGIGPWTAEMILLFSLQRPDIFSFGDYGIRKGLSLVYGHKEIDRERFERYRRRFSPHGSVASLYLWEVAGGAASSSSLTTQGN